MTTATILGVNAAHDASACLLRDGEIVAAVSEERLTRIKYFEGYPERAIAYCLGAGELRGLDEVDCLVVNQYAHTDHADRIAARGYAGTLIVNPSHHLLHALYAWAASGWDDQAILVVDGSGYAYGEHARRGSPFLGVPPPSDSMEEVQTTFSVVGGQLQLVDKRWALWQAVTPFFRFASLGHMYSAASQHIFGHWVHAGKVMGLAAFGNADTLKGKIVQHGAHGLEIDTDWVLSLPPRSGLPAHEDPFSRDLAAKVQDEIETAMLALALQVHDLTGQRRLSLSGGVALNSVANGRILREGPFDEVFITPAAGDSGISVGAALYGHWVLTGDMPSWGSRSDHLGRRYRPSEIDAAIDAHMGLVHRVPEADAAAAAAREVAGGLVIGWFEGSSELGPRALGHRSILADPRGASMRDHLNATVKFREPFRPYAASVLSEHAATFFETGDHSDPFMLTVSQVRPGRAAEIASVCHVDGTCRLQCVDADMAGHFRRLIEQFYELTGVPLVLNTSFNVRGEPMVETPTDAIQCFLASGIDVLYLDGQKLAKHRLDDSDAPGRLVPHPNALLALTRERRVAQGGWEAETATARTRTGYAIALDPSEAALLARVDGKMSVEALTQDEPNARAALERLGRKGLVAFAGNDPPPPRRGVSGTLGGPENERPVRISDGRPIEPGR